MSGNTRSGIREPAYLSAESLCWNRGASFAAESVRVRFGNTYSNLIDAAEKEEIVGKLWIVEIGRVRIHEEESGK